LNLYDVSTLAHYELATILKNNSFSNLNVTLDQLIGNLENNLKEAQAFSEKDPFNLGRPYGQAGDMTPEICGVAIQASFYDELTGKSTYADLYQNQVHWLFGSNAWGLSMMVGSASCWEPGNFTDEIFPYCLQHQVANLVGSLNGGNCILLGATGDGISQEANFDGLSMMGNMKKCPTNGVNEYKQFTYPHNGNWEFMDNVIAWPSTEPADDYTVITLMMYSRLLYGK